MIKKTITFKDFDGKEITEDWYFGLDSADIAKLELSSNGQLSQRLSRIGKTIDDNENNAEAVMRASGAEIIQLFEELILQSVGKRSEDGRRFIRNKDTTDDFVQTGSYSKLLIDLVTNPDKAADFVHGILPQEELERLQQGQPITDVPLPDQNLPAWYTEGRIPTDDEVKGLNDPKLLQEAFRRKSAPPSQ